MLKDKGWRGHGHGCRSREQATCGCAGPVCTELRGANRETEQGSGAEGKTLDFVAHEKGGCGGLMLGVEGPETRVAGGQSVA